MRVHVRWERDQRITILENTNEFYSDRKGVFIHL